MAEGHPEMVSVVIPVRDGASTIGEQLEALACQDFREPWEVVVADNGSRDGTVAVIERYRRRLPQLKLVDASSRPGQAYARNLGTAEARGSLLLFVDADDRVGPGYLEAMAGALRRSELVAARVEHDLLNPHRSASPAVANQEFEIGSPMGFLPFAGGCSLGARRSVFEAVGGFDPEAAPCEDVDFCWRAQLDGHELEFVPEAVLHYRHRSGARPAFRQARRSGEKAPWLYRRFRTQGMGRRSVRSALRFHGGAVKALTQIRSREDLQHCAYLVGYRVGLVQGCIRQRCLYL